MSLVLSQRINNASHGEYCGVGHGGHRASVTGGRRVHRTRDEDHVIAASGMTERERHKYRKTEEERCRWERANKALRMYRNEDNLIGLLRQHAGKTHKVNPRKALTLGTKVHACFRWSNKRFMTTVPTEIIGVQWMNCNGQKKTPHIYTIEIVMKGYRGKI